MPKEVIYGSLLPYDEESLARSVVELRWSRDGAYLQLVSRCALATDTSLGWHEDERGYQKAVDLATRLQQLGATLPVDVEPLTNDERSWLLDYLVGQFGAGLTVVDGYYVDLDRSGVNAIIRHLRRARDQSFGRDE